MKTKHFAFIALVCGFLLSSNLIFGQMEPEKQYYVTATTMHLNVNNENLTMDDWRAIEKEYFDNVIMKNEFIKGYNVVMHYYTADNTEIILVNLYEDWASIEKARDRSDELANKYWSDEKKRDAFFDKRMQCYSQSHSDEIYVTMPGAKRMTVKSDKPLVYYVRKSSFANPKDGSQKEFDELTKMNYDYLISKNEFLKGYYPYSHAWGSHGGEFVEVYVVDSLGDIEKAFDREEQLFKAQWKDEKSQKEMNKKMSKYFSKTHSDFIYRSVPGFQK